MNEKDALLIVDVQVDFLPGGRLAVPEGDAVVPVLNKYLALAQSKKLQVFVSRDCTRPGIVRSGPKGGRGPSIAWPRRPARDLLRVSICRPTQRSSARQRRSTPTRYSAFEGTDLAWQLHDAGAKRVLVGGLATDYCVRATVLDGLKQGFDVLLLQDAVHAVNVKPGDGERAIREMQDAGADGVLIEDFAP